MRLHLAVEDMEPNHWIAWVLNLPACYSSTTTAADAVALAPQKIIEYFSWLLDHNGLLPAVNDPCEVEVVETFHSYSSSEDPEYLVNAFFDDDRRPLGYWDIEIGLQLLNWTRQDLMVAVQSIGQEQLIMTISGEKRGSISGILHHMAIAENWYFSHLECGLEQAQLPCEPLETLVEVRRNIRKQLAGLIGDDRIIRNCEELWSARKVLRRTLWHERDHTQHIIQLLPHL